MFLTCDELKIACDAAEAAYDDAVHAFKLAQNAVARSQSKKNIAALRDTESKLWVAHSAHCKALGAWEKAEENAKRLAARIMRQAEAARQGSLFA
jgi:hypothetical protein